MHEDGADGGVSEGPPLSRSSWARKDFLEAGVDFENANAARIYDYFLGGAHNLAVDRALAARVAEASPHAGVWARGNRNLLMRVVRYCVEHGVRQFLDLGSGIPTMDHVHTTARTLAPETRVAYVDFEPVAVAHSQELLADVEGVTVTRADIRDPAAVLSAPTVTEVLDFNAPVAVLAVALVHFVSEADDPERVLAGYRDALVPGSYLAITHTSADYDDPELARRVETAAAVYRDSATPIYLRDRPRIHELLRGGELVDPGLVDISQWPRPDPASEPLGSYAALTRISAAADVRA